MKIASAPRLNTHISIPEAERAEAELIEGQLAALKVYADNFDDALSLLQQMQLQTMVNLRNWVCNCADIANMETNAPVVEMWRECMQLQWCAGALLQGQGFHQLLGAGLFALQGVEQLLPLRLQLLEALGHPIAVGGVVVELLLQLGQPLLLLPQPLLQLLALGLQRRGAALQLLAPAAALL